MTPNVLVVRGRTRDPGAPARKPADAGYDVRCVPDAESAYDEIRNALPDLCCSTGCCLASRGSRLAKELRSDARTRELPIIMLTGAQRGGRQGRGPRGVGRRLRDQAVLAARAQGADQSVLRRRAPEALQEPLEAGALRLDPSTPPRHGRRASSRARPDEFGCCDTCSRARSVCTRGRNCSTRCGGDHVYIEERTVDVHVRRLRRALEPFGQDALVETIRGSVIGWPLPGRTDAAGLPQ